MSDVNISLEVVQSQNIDLEIQETVEVSLSIPTALSSGVWSMITGNIEDQLDLMALLAGKAAAVHNHDDRYYTETEINAFLSGKENSFSKNTAFNKNFGTSAGTVSEGNHTHAYSSLTGLPDLTSLHTHSNKALLDDYTQTESDLADAVAKKHSHSNKAILDAVDVAFTSVLKINYDAAYSWGNHALAGYLNSESDPVFSAAAAAGITTTDISNWDNAYSWGNHASAGYQDELISGTNIKTINGLSLIGSGNLTISGGAVDSVNGQTGVVVLESDDIDDSSSSNKFVTAADISKLGNLSGVNTGDQDVTGLLVKAQNLSDLTNISTARTNLGLVAGGAGDIWVEKAGDTMTGSFVSTFGFTAIDLQNAGKGSGTKALILFSNKTAGGFPSGINKIGENEFLCVAGVGATSSIFSGGVNGDANRRIKILADGKFLWSPASGGADDVSLLRAGVNQLETEDNFIVDMGLTVNTLMGNYDSKMSGDTLEWLFFLDASVDRIGINNSLPAYRLDVVGDINIDAASAYRVAGAAGVSGSFTTVDGKTITVTKGIITGIV